MSRHIIIPVAAERLFTILPLLFSLERRHTLSFLFRYIPSLAYTLRSSRAYARRACRCCFKALLFPHLFSLLRQSCRFRATLRWGAALFSRCLRALRPRRRFWCLFPPFAHAWRCSIRYCCYAAAIIRFRLMLFSLIYEMPARDANARHADKMRLRCCFFFSSAYYVKDILYYTCFLIFFFLLICHYYYIYALRLLFAIFIVLLASIHPSYAIFYIYYWYFSCFTLIPFILWAFHRYLRCHFRPLSSFFAICRYFRCFISHALLSLFRCFCRYADIFTIDWYFFIRLFALSLHDFHAFAAFISALLILYFLIAADAYLFFDFLFSCFPPDIFIFVMFFAPLFAFDDAFSSVCHAINACRHDTPCFLFFFLPPSSCHFWFFLYAHAAFTSLYIYHMPAITFITFRYVFITSLSLFLHYYVFPPYYNIILFSSAISLHI